MRQGDLWPDVDGLSRACAGKRVIFWGCFDFFEKTIAQLDLDVAFLVDINKHVQGKAIHHGFDVFDPSVLATLEKREEHYIVISSSAFYEIIEQLESYGYTPGLEFAVTPVLSNFKVIADITGHEAQVLLSSSDVARDEPLVGGGLYVLNCATGALEKRVSGMTRGFAWRGTDLFVIDAQKGLRVLDRDFAERDCFPLPKGSVPHGVAIDTEQKLIYITLSIHDRIGVFDLDTCEEVDSLTLTEKYERSGRQYYAHHLNDLCLDGDSLYISMFSRTGNLQRNWLNGCIVEYDLVGKHPLGALADNLWQPHSIKILDGSLAFLDSMRGNLHLVAHQIESHFNGFVRGLDFDGKYYFVGQSVHRYFDRMQGASNNIAVDCGVFLYDRESKAARFLPTPMLRDINTLAVLKP